MSAQRGHEVTERQRHVSPCMNFTGVSVPTVPRQKCQNYQNCLSVWSRSLPTSLSRFDPGRFLPVRISEKRGYKTHPKCANELEANITTTISANDKTQHAGSNEQCADSLSGTHQLWWKTSERCDS